MKKRILTIVLALILCLPLFTSCDTEQPNETETELLTESIDEDNVSETEPSAESVSESESVKETESETCTEKPDDSDEDDNDPSHDDEEEDAKDPSDNDKETSKETDSPANDKETEKETQKPTTNDASSGLEYTKIGNAYAVTGIGSCDDLSIVIPKEYNGLPVKEIADYAFAENTEITSVKLQSSIIKIGVGAFNGCTKLKKVTLTNKLQEIGEKAFYGCSKLTSITIPASVTTIGSKAFYNCESLNSIDYNGKVSDASNIFSSLNVQFSQISNISCTDGTLKFDTSIKQAEYNTTTGTMPSNWNEFTYTDNNDTQFLNYISSSFFEYDYKFVNDQKFNKDGSINKAGIVAGAYTTNYSAATKLEDVTALVDAKWGYTGAQKREGGYAWKITLRNDLKWDDGTPIKAADFVYSMKQALDPDFMNYRANTYYDTFMIKNSKAYFFKNQEGSYETLGSQGYDSVQAAIDAGETLYVNIWYMWGAKGYLDAEGNECPEYVPITDETVYIGEYNGEPDSVSGAFLYQNYGTYLEPGTGYDACVYVENTQSDIKWEDVGIYSIDDENAIVICLDMSYEFLTDDGELSVWAPYYMSSLPLVKESLYEACKIAPADGTTLWTTIYNSSVATTASWGPYKLVQFEADSHYRLEKNEHWFGWNMEQYNNQYNVTAINCTKEFYWSDQTMGFLNGTYDDCSINNENVESYGNSKYAYYTSTSTGTFGMQLYSNLDILKNSGNNNGILAIQEFRHAFNLALNRSDIVEKIWPGTSVPCFGLVNVAYYYDIENAPELSDGGQYRNTKLAKEGILRAYGFTQGSDGKWSSGDLKGLSLEDAYETLTGYNPTLAKEKMKEAIEILLADPNKYGYDSRKNITIIYGSSADASNHRFKADYLQAILDDLTKGTALENKIDVVFKNVGNEWAEAFRSGETQIGFGYGFSGNPFNPFDIIGAFVNPDDGLNYHTYWDTSAIDMTLTMPAGDYEGAGQTITMSVQNWYYCLNGLAESENQAKTYNWGAGFASTEARLTILSALEELTIKESRSIMLIADSGGTLLGAKFSYFSDDEHTFMGFGGIRYMEVNYTDAEWAEFVNDNNNDLSEIYKQTN